MRAEEAAHLDHRRRVEEVVLQSQEVEEEVGVLPPAEEEVGGEGYRRVLEEGEVVEGEDSHQVEVEEEVGVEAVLLPGQGEEVELQEQMDLLPPETPEFGSFPPIL